MPAGEKHSLSGALGTQESREGCFCRTPSVCRKPKRKGSSSRSKDNCFSLFYKALRLCLKDKLMENFTALIASQCSIGTLGETDNTWHTGSERIHPGDCCEYGHISFPPLSEANDSLSLSLSLGSSCFSFSASSNERGSLRQRQDKVCLSSVDLLSVQRMACPQIVKFLCLPSSPNFL